MSGQSCESPSRKFMKSGELKTANQRKTKVASAVKNYQKSLRSQLLQEVGSRGHLGTLEAVATLTLIGIKLGIKCSFPIQGHCQSKPWRIDSQIFTGCVLQHIQGVFG